MTKILEKQTQTFNLTEEQELLRKTIRKVAEENFCEEASKSYYLSCFMIEV